ncbi:MAG: transcription antitermination factor NusB [Alicyclobacillus sp.]|nr:transcription antitermination factor NusB [Alicyclobacillus sp.]
MRRHEAREKTLQALYQLDVGKGDPEQAVVDVLAEVKATDQDVAFIRARVLGVYTNLSEIDALLESSLENWRLDRVARTDLNALRLAVYELLHEPEVDVATIVDEAVELAKEYGSEDSGRFVNGVLARVLRAIPARPG